MNYGVYKNARNASWQCLIDCNVKQLPINPIAVAAKYGIKCKAVNSDFLDGDSGAIRKNIIGIATIYYNKNHTKERQKFTIMHELGHYLLGHLGDKPLSRSEKNCNPEQEQAADRFSADVFMPACVLWGLNIRTAEEIAQLCNVSMQAAQIRAERMAVLYQRNKFLSHQLERTVFQQFKPWIDEQKRFL